MVTLNQRFSSRLTPLIYKKTSMAEVFCKWLGYQNCSDKNVLVFGNSSDRPTDIHSYRLVTEPTVLVKANAFNLQKTSMVEVFCKWLGYQDCSDKNVLVFGISSSDRPTDVHSHRLVTELTVLVKANAFNLQKNLHGGGFL